jgi:hypothetical protein
MRGFQHDVNNLNDSINKLNAKIDALENTIRILAGSKKVTNLSFVSSDTTIDDGYIVTGTLNASVKISIAPNATVTLDGVNINGDSTLSAEYAAAAGLTCSGNATIILKDGTTNIVRGLNQNYPGVFVPVGSTLTIQGETQGNGKLIASSYGFGAGIGGGNALSCGHIIIESGTIEATGGKNAAGIGGGQGDPGSSTSCGNITISGGTVTATGGKNAAGIGSGQRPASCGTITINNGTVTATGGAFAAGIGSGYGATCGKITISGGTVTATGSNGLIGSMTYAGGAGIGSGIGADNGGSCTDITISGGTIDATGGDGAAGIGGGSGTGADYYTTCDNITISGGTVTATGGAFAAGIGSGKGSDNHNSICGNITIENTVNLNYVKATKGTNATNSIGASYSGSCGTVTIGGVTGAISDSPYTYPPQQQP